MPRVAFPRRGARDASHRPSGLDALAALINDVLGGWDTQPLPVGMMSSIQTSPTDRPLPVRGRASRGLEPAAVHRSDDDHDDHGDHGDHGDGDGRTGAVPVDAEHVETWHLVTLAQQGDGEAFGILYDRYVDSVFRFIYYRVNDRALAEDFTSETFVRALRRIATISYQGRDIGAWFVTIARNIVLDHVKSARHRLETPTGETIEGPERAPSTESAVMGALASEQLMAAVEQLGDEQRECVMLRFMQGMSVTETAAIMGKNDGAIKALQHRAVRKLAELIGDDLR